MQSEFQQLQIKQKNQFVREHIIMERDSQEN